MYKEDTLIEVMRANRRGDIYLICFDTIKVKEEVCVAYVTNEEAWLWHTRFYHLNLHTLNKLVKLNLVKGLHNIKFEKDHLCSTCEMGKLKRSAHKSKSDLSYDKPLQLIHVDLCGPISVMNSQVERKNRTIIVAAKTMLNAYGLPFTFWAEVVSTACYIHNRYLIVNRLAKTPHHLLSLACNQSISSTFDPLSLQTPPVVTPPEEHLTQETTKVPTPTEAVFSQFQIEAPSSSHENLILSTKDPSSLQKLNSTFNLPQDVKWTKDHPQSQIIGDPSDGVKTRATTNFAYSHALEFIVYQMDVKSVFLNGKLKEESEFEISMMGELMLFLGWKVKQSTKSIFINQSKYIEDLLMKYEIANASPMRTPMAPRTRHHADINGLLVECKLYRASHLFAVKQILRYLKKSPSLGHWYERHSGFDILVYKDSDYRGCQLDKKGTFGSCQILGGKLVSWSSKKQNCVSTSTAGVEYVAAASCCSQALLM
ncbi:hypothetical protein OSB04_024272 [Centaurea solstitialis]|uniref:GAG-pre-integrase domain-containing protein n=1 Tax=Centaurea solstitialis TaxID=347529 RepID=A0AA38WA70_9ASTR|nr:hypothetical protein OSB04_024272 [Centaurea solstitialis]